MNIYLKKTLPIVKYGNNINPTSRTIKTDGFLFPQKKTEDNFFLPVFENITEKKKDWKLILKKLKVDKNIKNQFKEILQVSIHYY